MGPNKRQGNITRHENCIKHAALGLEAETLSLAVYAQEILRQTSGYYNKNKWTDEMRNIL